MKILSMNYQRNGVSGDPFYSIEYMEDGLRMIATFTTKTYHDTPGDRHEDQQIDHESCRVVDSMDNKSDWRGDVIADLIQGKFAKSNQPTFYDWMEYINNL